MSDYVSQGSIWPWSQLTSVNITSRYLHVTYNLESAKYHNIGQYQPITKLYITHKSSATMVGLSLAFRKVFIPVY